MIIISNPKIEHHSLSISETPEEIEKQLNQERHFNFVLELKKVLSFTNAVPFKIKSGKYFCAYCYTTVDSFEHPAELRVHTANHKEERIKRLDQILRPQFLNEILRVDVELLQCEVCSIPLPTWNDMFVHLNQVHDIQLDQAYTKLIPYRLKGPVVYCALCNEEFQGFLFLDSHMNAHYCNYMCSECGDTFVTENRLKHHVSTHNTGKYPCSHCGKVFSLEKYKKKHEGMVHKEAKMFKCVDCTEAFHTEYERHLHVVEEHKERVRISTCELCGKTYSWKPYYLAHMRKVHSRVKKYVCTYCNKGFTTKHDVTMHEQRHTGNGKHVCVFCHKNYVTISELKKHFKKHVKDIRFVDEKDLEAAVMDNVIVLEGSGVGETSNESEILGT